MRHPTAMHVTSSQKSGRSNEIARIDTVLLMLMDVNVSTSVLICLIFIFACLDLLCICVACFHGFYMGLVLFELQGLMSPGPYAGRPVGVDGGQGR